MAARRGARERSAAASTGTAPPPTAPGHEVVDVVVVGDAGQGKSALIGRLRDDTGPPAEGAGAAAMVRTARREYAIVDVLDGRALVDAMAAGAAAAAVAIVVIGAPEDRRAPPRNFGFHAGLLGVRHAVVAVTKMDRADYAAERYDAMARACRSDLGRIGVEARHVVPVSSRHGDNIVRRSERMPWYDGPTLVEALDGLLAPPPPAALPLRLPVHEVDRTGGGCVVVGRVATGRLQRGDALLFSPSNRSARVAAIADRGGGAALDEAVAGQTVGVTLYERLPVERGEVASHAHDPPIETNVFRARLMWWGGAPLTVGQTFGLRLNILEVPVDVQAIEPPIGAAEATDSAADRIDPGGVAEVVLRTPRMIALDTFGANPVTGRFVLVDGGDAAGCGVINMEGYPDQRGLVTVKSTNVTAVEHRVSTDARTARNNHQGGVLWFTGLSGAGKSTLAVEVEQRLFRNGYQTYVLDGDNVRRGLNANLGFSPDDRAENIRRVGEVAALFADAGFIVISAFISPYQSDRQRARAAAASYGAGGFHEIHIDADLEECERRDPKGLYKKARRGEIKDFTGVSAPYEPPENPDLAIDTGEGGIDDCARRIVDYIVSNFAYK